MSKVLAQAQPPAQDLNLPGCTPGENGLNLVDCYRLNGQTTVGEVYSEPTTIVNLVVRNLFVISGVFLFILVIYAGFQFLQDTSKGKDTARDIATTALIGFIIMFAAYWILQIVKVVTGVDVGI